MRRITQFLIAAALVTLSTDAALAQSSRYLGPSEGTGDGATGILGFNELCQAAYGDDARFCTSRDVLRSGSPPADRNVQQWIMPTIVGSVIDPIEGILVIDITGRSSSLSLRRRELSCQGWSEAVDTVFGLTMTSKGSFSTLHCASDLPAACCQVNGEHESGK